MLRAVRRRTGPFRKPELPGRAPASADGLAAAWLTWLAAMAATASWLIWSGPPHAAPPAPVVISLAEPETPAPGETAAAESTGAEPSHANDSPAPAAAADPPPATNEPALTATPTAAQPPEKTPDAVKAAEAPPAAMAGPAEPAPVMLAAGAGGSLPKIAADGRRAWQAYARSFDAAPDRPRVAIILADLGLNRSLSAQAIAQLPPDVTLAFSPYAAELTDWLARARAEGHEALLLLPMEPNDYPASDPGPRALMTTLSASDNVARLEWLLARATGYAGVATYMGSKFTASADDLRPVMAAVSERGLLFVDTRSTPRSVAARMAREIDVPFAANSRFIDNDISAAAIDARLGELERIARNSGSALGVGFPHPLTLARISVWAEGLAGRGLALAPVSAIVLRPSGG